MACRQEAGTAVVVRLAAEIDLTTSERACGQLDAAVACGATVVIADLTSTWFCDCASLRRLLAVQQRAASGGIQVRFVMPSGSPVRRLAGLTGLTGRCTSTPACARPPPGSEVPVTGFRRASPAPRRRRRAEAWGRPRRNG
jgi:anti-anti-sigma factor